MPRLIPLPDTSAPGGERSTNLYAVTNGGGNFSGVNKNPNSIRITLDQRIDPATITGSTVLLSRHWLASGTLEDVQAAWRDFLALIDGAAAAD